MVTPVELLRAYDDAERQMPLPTVGRFGGFWHYDVQQNFICCDADGSHYELDLDRGDLEEFPLHLAEKPWMHAEALGDFLLMLHHVFHMNTWKDTPRFTQKLEPETPA
jgi:hypothetical protein